MNVFIQTYDEAIREAVIADRHAQMLEGLASKARDVSRKVGKNAPFSIQDDICHKNAYRITRLCWYARQEARKAWSNPVIWDF